jgi:IclR family acetate operon transcriptional repressor
LTDLLSVMRVMRFALENPCEQHDSKMAQQLKLSSVVIERYLSELLQAGLLTADSASRFRPERRVFQPGPLALQMAAAVAANYPVARIAAPVLRELADATGERAVLNVYVPSLKSVVCVAMQQGSHPLQYDVDVGEVKALHAGASGKVVLARLSPSEIKTVLESTLEQVTDRTDINAASISLEIDEIRRQGYAVSRGQRIHGAVGVATSLLMPGGLPGSLVLTIPEYRFQEDSSAMICEKIILSAQKLEQLFAASPFPLHLSDI